MTPSPLRTCLAILAAGVVAAVAQQPVEANDPKRNRLSPALDLLPAGSTLKDVRIPRYDKKLRRAGLMRAEILEVRSEQQVTGENIELRVFSKAEKETLRLHIGAAEYFRLSGLLEAKEVITLSGEFVKARGAGGLFHLDSRQGFVRGPVVTTLTRPPGKVDGKDPNSPKPARRVSPMAPPDLPELEPEFIEPTPLSRSEQAEVARLVASRSKSVTADRAPTRQLLTRSQQLTQAAEIGLRAFSNRVNRGNLLGRIPAGDPLPPGLADQAPARDELIVTSQGGMYVDSEKGHLGYLRNIEVRESRFTMTCSNRLLVFFESLGLASEKQLEDLGDFTNLKSIVASGGVRIERHDPEGKRPPIVATAELAVVDVASGDFVLQGGSPTIQQGPNLLRADQPDLYLRYYSNGNIFAEEGRWTTIGDLASLREDPPKPGAPAEGQDAPDEARPPVGPPPDEKAPAPPETSELLTVTCTGGIYFDARDGQLVYLGEVAIEESRFRVECSRELKVFLRRNPEAGPEPETGLEAFSDVDFLVASGSVTVTRTGGKEKHAPAVASAEHAILNARTNDIILQGGTPTIRQGDNALQAGAPDLYLRFYENGSLFAEPGPWTTTGDLANLRTKPGEEKKPAQLITATSHGGLSFDSLQGHIVYREDVEVREPRFRMTCKGEMKIYLEERPAEDGERLEGPEAFSDVKAIVSTGGVLVVRRDPNGKAAPITASADTATYDAKSGDIVLRGGYPTIRQGKSYAKAEEPGLYIRFYANGSFYSKTGKWDLNFQTKDFEDLRKQRELNNGG